MNTRMTHYAMWFLVPVYAVCAWALVTRPSIWTLAVAAGLSVFIGLVIKVNWRTWRARRSR